MSLNSRIIKALEPMKLKVTVSEHPLNDEEGKTQQPDTFLVIIPGTDDFPVCADDRPIVETEEVELALYCKGNYLKMRDEITTRLLDADITITSRKYMEFEKETKYHHYIFEVMGISE